MLEKLVMESQILPSHGNYNFCYEAPTLVKNENLAAS